jgi:2-oxoglutarate ferredoxin oxidoreductase subunit alpha
MHSRTFLRINVSATESGVTPLGVPGDAKHLVVTDSDEHDEEGHIVEDAVTRVKMMEKRLLKKLPRIKAEMEPPSLYGERTPRVVIAGWGSTYGVIREAVDELSRSQSIAMLHFSELYPFPGTETFDFVRYLRNAKKTICVEKNATGQFARLMRAETGFEFTAQIHGTTAGRSPWKSYRRSMALEVIAEFLHGVGWPSPS